MEWYRQEVLEGLVVEMEEEVNGWYNQKTLFFPNEAKNGDCLYGSLKRWGLTHRYQCFMLPHRQWITEEKLREILEKKRIFGKGSVYYPANYYYVTMKKNEMGNYIVDKVIADGDNAIEIFKNKMI